MNITPFATDKPDPQALDVARWVHKKAGAYATYLFGSRARGDYRSDSDIDILLITPGEEDENWLDALEEEARQAQQEQHGMKTGIDMLSMTPEEFNRRRRLINNLAWTIAREGIPVMAPERLGYGSNRNDDEEDLNYQENSEQDSTEYTDETLEEIVDWHDVSDKLKDSTNYARDLTIDLEAGILEHKSDKTFGNTAQQALENGYKSLLAAHGLTYPTTGRDGHNLRILVDLVRNGLNWPLEQPVPGEEFQYLADFDGAQRYSHEHAPLDKQSIAYGVPEVVRELNQMIQGTWNQHHPTEGP